MIPKPRFARSGSAAFQVFGVAVLLFAGGGAARAQDQSGRGEIVLDRRVSIVVPPGEPVAVQRAAGDLLSDLIKVLGEGPRIVHDARDAGAASLTIGATVASKPGDRVPDAESFSIVARKVDRRHSTLDLLGADMRGTLYAIYQFSNEFLGVDPMYYWTDHLPAHREAVAVPATLAKRYPAPVFRYRGIFINDEDLLTGWAPGEATDHTGISMAVWDKIFETILRLKGNMIVPGSFPFPGEPQEAAVADRGLILHQHHAEPLGINVTRWPKDVPYNYTQHPEYLRNAWRNAVAAVPPSQEVLWTVGLRGLSDQAYAVFDTSVKDNPKAQGRVIGQAIEDEMATVKARQPNALFATNVWSEGAKLLHDGDLKLSPEVMRIWPDTGYLDMQDNGALRPGDGAYIHVAMMNRNANQLTELNPVERIFAQMGRYEDAGATSFLLVNTSDIRPVALTTEAVLDFAWSGKKMGSAKAYYESWGTRQFGAAAAPEVEEILHEYFAAPFDRPDQPQPVGDQFYHTQVRNLTMQTMVDWPAWLMPTQSPLWRAPYPLYNQEPQPAWILAQDLEARCRAAQPRWDHAWQRAQNASKLVDPARRDFYQASVLTMIAIPRESNRMLLEFSQAVEEYHQGDKAKAQAHLHEAEAAIARLKQQEALAEYGKWKNWYTGDWHTNVAQTESHLESFSRWLDDPNALIPPLNWSLWEAYYHIMHYQGSKEVDVHPSVR